MEAFRWTEAGGMEGLGSLSTNTDSQARDVNADGSVIVGESGSIGTPRAFRWTAQGMLELVTPEPADSAIAYAVNADGSVVVGSYTSQAGSQAFRWTAALGMVNLGRPAGAVSMEATDVSADGNVVVGRVFTAERIDAFVWKASHGAIYLSDALERAGIDSAGLLLGGAHAISGDGVTITGSADDSFTQLQVPWLTELPR
jgi:probable HAF family extracellular repeat protein